MKHSLQLKLTQQLALTPQLQQSIRLLQLSTLELQQEIKQMVQDNPLLDIEEEEDGPHQERETLSGEDINSPNAETETDEQIVSDNKSIDDETATDDQTATDTDWQNEDRQENYGKPHSDNQNEERQIASTEVSLSDHLTEQLALLKLSVKDRQIVMYLIGNLDEDGFLKDEINELLDSLRTEMQINQEEIDTAIRNLQKLRPAGVGARNLSECLELQILAMPEDTEHKLMALTLVTNYLSDLAVRDYKKLKKRLGCDDNTLRNVQKLIQSLNPRPGAAFNVSETRYITPDVYVKKQNSKWKAFLNFDAKPKLKINKMYAEILQKNKGAKFQNIKDQLTDAKWFIKNVEQRYDTILRVSQAIIDEQHNFFEHGDLGMRPMVLREIADKLDLHESTISRVTTHKYMMTPRGILELKYFFGSHVTTHSGSAYSSTAIRALIKKIVEDEDKRKPTSDSQISKLLSSQGIVVARRTVAKYREALQILPMNLRKDL